MKFNVLVAAAMVITSVSASGKGGLGGLFKKGGGMTRSESAWSLLDKNNPEPGSSQDSPRRGVGQKLSQSTLARKLRSGSSRNSPKHKPRPGPSQDPLAHGSRPGPSQDPPKDELRPGPSQNPPVNEPRPGLSLDEVLYNSDTPQVPEPRKKDPICDAIARELSISWGKISDFDSSFSKQIPDFYKLLTKERREKHDKMMEKKLIKFKKTNSGVGMSENELMNMMRMTKLRENNSVVGTSGDDVIRGNDEEDEDEDDDDEEEKRKAHDLNLKEMQKWRKSNPEDIPRLQEIKAESISLEQDHSVIWAKLLSNKCPTEKLERFSPETMKEQGYFPKWDDDIDLIDLRRK
ncbi:hypothetical protein BASA61_006182 [Batrachochytrium salamandrivorans]|nr:hypothetical protein BASA60_005414 [Batrachochytrium salamandrivorans]KAH6587829.1 hypothetical protein BASA61_006182 [Batrachochytrium salamandrivorans]